MSLSDYIRYMRALRGGVTPWEIAESTGLPAGEIHLLEVKHRRMGEDATLERLASYFEIDLEELTRRREAYRKRLTIFLEEQIRSDESLAVRLESGETLEGRLAWYSRDALALKTADDQDPYIIQRAWVADWRPAGTPQWLISGAG